MKEIEQNIIDTIKKFRKSGVTAASMQTLYQNTPTKGVNVPVSAYRRMFEEAAARVCAVKHFHILGY